MNIKCGIVKRNKGLFKRIVKTYNKVKFAKLKRYKFSI